jgi:membrane protein CcdC involved in cytochrome C biogenesis
MAWGTNAYAGFIVTLANMLQYVAKSKCLRLSPIGWVLYCLVYAMRTCLEFLSKFAIIIAGVTGRDFWNSAKTGYDMLKRHFVGGYVTSRVGYSVMTLGATVFSLIIGVIVWASIAADEGHGMFYTKYGGEVQDILQYVLAVTGLIMHIYPFFGIAMIALLGSVIADAVGGAFIFGILCGIISHFLFDYIAGVVLDVTDAIFVLVAMDRDNNTMSTVGQEIYKSLIQMPELSNWKTPAGGAYQPMVNNNVQMTAPQ